MDQLERMAILVPQLLVSFFSYSLRSALQVYGKVVIHMRSSKLFDVDRPFLFENFDITFKCHINEMASR